MYQQFTRLGYDGIYAVIYIYWLWLTSSGALKITNPGSGLAFKI